MRALRSTLPLVSLAAVAWNVFGCGGSPRDPSRDAGVGDAPVAVEASGPVVDAAAPDEPIVDGAPGAREAQSGAEERDAAAFLARPDVAPRPVLVPPLPPPAPPAGDCGGVAGSVVTRDVEHLGAGREITLRPTFTGGAPLAGRDLRGCVGAEDPAGAPVPVLVERRALAAGYTALVVDPGTTPEENELVRQGLRELLAARPASETIAVFRWGADLRQVVTFTSDRPLLVARALRGLSPAPEAGRMPIEGAIAAVAPQLLAVGGVARDALRALVVVTPRTRRAPPAAAREAAGAALALWLSPDAPSWSAADIPDGHRFALPAGAAALARRLDEYREAGHLVAAYCGTGAAAELVFGWGAGRGTGGGRPHLIPQSLAENLGGRCDHAAIVAGRRPATRRIELLFTAAERLAAAAAAGTRQEFSLSVKLSPEHLPVAAEAHQRGKGSFNCARPSYNVKLSGKRPRFVLPGAATSQFLLLSMCEDDLYLRNHTAARLLAAEGLFPGAFGFVELVVDGVSKGVYLMTEDPSDWMRQQHPGTFAIVRRLANGGTTYPEVDWTSTSSELATFAYGSLLAAAEGRSGEALEAALRARFDLDKYLSWLAAMSILMSGDYVDEILFQVTDATDDEGSEATFQLMYVWDQENLLSPCHNMGRFAVDDRRGLLYCAEAELDRLIVSDPLLYRRYVDALERLVARLSRPRFEEALGATLDRLLEHFSDPQTVAAMTELRRRDPAALGDPERAKALVRDMAAELLARFDSRQEDLEARIAFYRAHPEAPYPTDAAADVGAADAGAGPEGGALYVDAAAPDLDVDGAAPVDVAETPDAAVGP